MSSERLHIKIFIIIFIMCLFLPLVFFNRDKEKISIEENRYFTDFPDPFTRSGFEDWVNDNIGFRSGFLGLHANIMYRLLGLSPSEKIMVGKNGWLFYTGDNNMSIANGTYPLFDDDIERIAVRQKEISDYLKERDCDYYLILPPSKVSVYYDMLRGNYMLTETPADIVEKALVEKTDVNVINLKEKLLEAKKDEKVYLMTDTHWNQAGAYIAYKQIHEEIMPERKEPEVELFETTVKGEFSNMMGASNLLKDEPTKGTRIKNPKAECVGGDNEKEFIYHNEKGNGQTCLMLGDSLFGADWNIRELIAEDYTDFIFVWSYDFDTDKVEKYKPDVVYYDIAERFLSDLDNKAKISR